MTSEIELIGVTEKTKLIAETIVAVGGAVAVVAVGIKFATRLLARFVKRVAQRRGEAEPFTGWPSMVAFIALFGFPHTMAVIHVTYADYELAAFWELGQAMLILVITVAARKPLTVSDALGHAVFAASTILLFYIASQSKLTDFIIEYRYDQANRTYQEWRSEQVNWGRYKGLSDSTTKIQAASRALVEAELALRDGTERLRFLELEQRINATIGKPLVLPVSKDAIPPE